MSEFHLYDFNGSVKRNKLQDAVFNSLNSRDRFLQQLENERKERAEGTKRENAAVVLQKTWRGKRSRKAVRDSIRAHFDSAAREAAAPSSSPAPPPPGYWDAQAARINACFESNKDEPRLLALCSALLAAARSAPSRPALVQSVKRRMLIANLLKAVKALDKGALAVPLRFIEEMTGEEDWPFLIKRGYFESLQYLIAISWQRPREGELHVETRLPPKLEHVCEVWTRPVRHMRGENRMSALSSLLSRVVSWEDRQTSVCVLLPYVGRMIGAGIEWTEMLSAVSTAAESLPASRAPTLAHALLTWTEEKGIDSLSPSDRSQLMWLVSETVSTADAAASHASASPAPSTSNAEPMQVDAVEDKVTSFVGRDVERLLSSDWLLTACLSAAEQREEGSDSRAVWCLVRIVSCVPAFHGVLSRRPGLLARMWTHLEGMAQRSAFGAAHKCLATLSNGHSLSGPSRDRFIPALSLFAKLLVLAVSCVDDADFSPSSTSPQLPLPMQDLKHVARTLRDVTLGLIDLAFPEDFMRSFSNAEDKRAEASQWQSLYESLVACLRALHSKDQTTHWLPAEFWCDHGRQVVLSRGVLAAAPSGSRRRGRARMAGGMQPERPFAFVRYLREEGGGTSGSDSEGESSSGGAGPSNTDMRNLSIIRTIPFVVPFMQRVKMFHELINQDKEMNNIPTDPHDFFGGSQPISISVRRQHLYEDAFEALSLRNTPNLRPPIRVHMINWAGLDEIGVDGGGIFREFLSELVRTAFDPQRGFFVQASDRSLYPNPAAASLYPDNYTQHFYFLGRLVAKLLYEKQLAEMHLSEFFVRHLLGAGRVGAGRHRTGGGEGASELHLMRSYDEQVHRQLVSLRDASPEELADLQLDFSVIEEQLGKAKVVDLVPGGRDMPVTPANRLEYIQAYVHYCLYSRLEILVDAMRAGVSSVLEPYWLGMFSPVELQRLISGAEVDVDVADMRAHTEFHNLKDDSDRDYASEFWSVVEAMGGEERRMLLKFITGCSRPPLDGFRAIYPAIGIQLVHDETRLPTSATCMNLLKLPKYGDRKTMEDKIRYAISAGAGFELT